MNTNNENQAAEKISAYIDDALNVDDIESLFEVNDSIKLADSHFSLATRYHMIGDAIRGELSDASMVDVSTQIQRALCHESLDVTVSAKPVKKASLESRFDLFSWLEIFARPLTGLAVAASVAALMVVSVIQLESSESGQQLAVSSEVLPAAALDTLMANKQSIDDPVNKDQRVADFDVYLTEHAEFAAQDTLQGRIPYVRAVSYEAE
ncbi:MAG: RseA family anti-sigma factor [Gammaproteobacteria bacterium]|nr:RseA family anti-sigma factor [Gammaproteobacteria bacterium]